MLSLYRYFFYRNMLAELFANAQERKKKKLKKQKIILSILVRFYEYMKNYINTQEI